MAGIFIALALLAWLLLLVDWKDLRGVLSQGGWASIVVYGVVFGLVVWVLVSPETVGHAPAMHH